MVQALTRSGWCASLWGLALLGACGGGSSAGPTDVVGDGGGSDATGDVIEAGAPFTPQWAHALGAPEEELSGAENHESPLGLMTTADGAVVGVAERRFRRASSTESAILFSFDAEGALAYSRALLFDEPLTRFAMAAGEAGGVLLAADVDELTVTAIDADGTQTWSKALAAPQASGGPELTDLVAAGGAIYVAGAVEPSGGSEQGFVGKLDAAGEPVWARSWSHSEDVDPDAQVAVDDAGVVYVTDGVAPPFEATYAWPVVLAFGASGEALAQRQLLVTVDGNMVRFDRSSVASAASGVTWVGLRRSILDEEDGLLVYRVTLDAALEVVSQSATRIVTDDNLFTFEPFRVAGGVGDVLHAAVTLGDARLVLRFAGAGGVAEAFGIEAAAGGPAFVDDDDELRVVVAPAAGGAVYVAGTVEATAAVRLVPRTLASFPASARAEDIALDVGELTLEATTGESVAIGADEDSVVDDPADGDRDVMVFRVAPR